jgi:cystathionine gamma-synthase
MLFPSSRVASTFIEFFTKRLPSASQSVDIVELVPRSVLNGSDNSLKLSAVWACLFPSESFPVAKEFWQHTGNGVSSRRAEYCYALFQHGLLGRPSESQAVPDSPRKGPRRYQRKSINGADAGPSPVQDDSHNGPEAPDSYIEERFGRNLDFSLGSRAKVAVRRRIAGKLTADVDLNRALQLPAQEAASKPRRGIPEDDVYLYMTGMNAIFNTHQCLLRAGGEKKSVCYG